MMISGIGVITLNRIGVYPYCIRTEKLYSASTQLEQLYYKQTQAQPECCYSSDEDSDPTETEVTRTLPETLICGCAGVTVMVTSSQIANTSER
eukprot:2151819-Rhodomonas_salina.1